VRARRAEVRSNKRQTSEIIELSTAALSNHSGRLKQALENLHQPLEEFEEALEGKETARPQEQGGLDLLSVPELCQELGMGKSWVYGQLKVGEIPSYRLGRNLKVRREDLEEYLNSRRHSA